MNGMTGNHTKTCFLGNYTNAQTWLILATALLLSACSPGVTIMEGSRYKLYDTIPDLAADSTQVVVVHVRDRWDNPSTTDPDGTANAPTVTSVGDVVETLTSATLASALDVPEARGVSPAAPGDEIKIVQMGATDMAATPAPLLEPGQTYLLFLSVPDEPHDGAFWVTGADAGIFQSDGEGFTQPVDSGDAFPATITRDDLG